MISQSGPLKSSDTLLFLENVEKVYHRKKRSLYPTSIEFQQGKLICLVGPNGSGKSTLIKLITRLIQPTAGNVTYKDPYLVIGYMPETIDLPGNFTCKQLMKLLSGRSSDNSYANEFIELMQIQDYINVPVKKLSKGMQKKVGMVSALTGNSNFLILDEPLEGLDTIDRDKLVRFLAAKVQLGLTVVLSTHILYGLDNITDSAYFIKDGKVHLRLTGNEAIFNLDIPEDIQSSVTKLMNISSDSDSKISQIYHLLYGGSL
jgi:ABC-2 type transport system ATP-binding protein